MAYTRSIGGFLSIYLFHMRNKLFAGMLMVALLVPSVAPITPVRAQTTTDNLCVTNGQYRSTAISGNTLYLGGDFTYVGPASGHAAALDATTGIANFNLAKVTGVNFANNTDTVVNAVAPDGVGGWYVGGSFTTVGTSAVTNLAHIKADGTLDSTWLPNPNNVVKAIAVSGNKIFIGGLFTTIGGQNRNFIAAVDSTTGATISWNPAANNAVASLVTAGNTLYVGGYFTTIARQSRYGVAAIDATTGRASTWDPHAISNIGGTGVAPVLAILLSGNLVYLGGSFTTIGGQARNVLAAVDATTGKATSWNPLVTTSAQAADVETIALVGNTVYVGGIGTYTSATQTRRALAAFNATTGALTSWNPAAINNPGSTSVISVSGSSVSGTTLYVGGNFLQMGGQVRDHLAQVDLTTGAATNWNPGAGAPVVSLARFNNTFFAGGSFSTVNGVDRHDIAALDLTTGAATSWNPNADGSVVTSKLSTDGTTLYVAGGFANIGGQHRGNLAQIDLGTSLATNWYPLDSGAGQSVNGYLDGSINSIDVSNAAVYVGGYFTGIKRTGIGYVATREYVLSFDTTTAALTPWDPVANAQVFRVVVSPDQSTVYVGGDFSSFGYIGNSTPRGRIAAIDAKDGAIINWNPNADGTVQSIALDGTTVYFGGSFVTVGGQPRSKAASADVATGTVTTWNPNAVFGSVESLAVASSTVFLGGGFSNVGGQARLHAAAVDGTNGTVSSWNPAPTAFFCYNNSCVSTITATDTGKVYVGGAFTDVLGDPSHTGIAAVDPVF